MAQRILNLVIVFQLVNAIVAADYIPAKKCATLYSQSNFEGEEFVLNDFDQSVSTHRDFRNSIDGWKNTGSIRVENECSMHFCDETYFTGNCSALTGKDNQTTFSTEIRSANCTCERQCSCERVHLPTDIYRQGRAYLKGGCRKCDTEYIPLVNLHGNVDYSNLVEAIVIRSGCNLTLYSEPSLQGESRLIKQEIVEDFNGTFRSYEITCDKVQHFPESSQEEVEVFEIIPISDTSEELVTTLSAMNNVNKTNPGFEAAVMSYVHNRSWKNAYIIFIGHLPPSYIFGITGCNSVLGGPIKECRIPVDMTDLRINNVELRIIFYDDRQMNDVEDDYQIIVSMHDYITNHEELKYKTPNAVILPQRITAHEDYTKEDSIMQRKLKVLDALRNDMHESVFAEYSNVIYLLRNEERYSKPGMDRKNPEETVKKFEKSVRDNWNFTEPITITTHQFPQGLHTLVNGFRKMENGGYWPMNIRDNLLRICENSKDELGHAIIKAAFEDDKFSSDVTLITREWLPKNHTLVNFFRECLTSTSPPEDCPSVSWKPPRNDTTCHKMVPKELSCNCEATQTTYRDLEERIILLEQQFKNSTSAYLNLDDNGNGVMTDDMRKRLEERIACLEQIGGHN